MPVFLNEPELTGPFGEAIDAELHPLVQLSSARHGNSTRHLDVMLTGTGSSPTANGLFAVSTGATAGSRATLRSRRLVPYRGGQGLVNRFTTRFDTPAAGCTQMVGWFNEIDGLAVGYNGTSFGALYRNGGELEVQTLTVTTASTTAENVTVTLEGVAKLVAVTNSGVIATTAYEIAQGDYTTTGSGWRADQIGNTVIFRAMTAGNKAGVFTLAGTTAVGAFAEVTAGANPTDLWTPLASFDPGIAGFTPDPSKLLPWATHVPYLGGGNCQLYVYHPVLSRFVLAHVHVGANLNTLPTFVDPALPLSVFATNGATTSNVSAYSASLMGAVVGPHVLSGAPISAKAAKSGVGTTSTPILTLRNPWVVPGSLKANRVGVWVRSIQLSNVGAQQTIWSVVLNPTTLTGANYAQVGGGTTALLRDTSATAYTGGTELVGPSHPPNWGDKYDYHVEDEWHLNPGDTLVIAAAAASGTITAYANIGTIDDR